MSSSGNDKGRLLDERPETIVAARSESEYSMDSFVAEQPMDDEEIRQAADKQARDLMASYISPSSGTTGSTEPTTRTITHPVQDTIDTVAKQQTVIDHVQQTVIDHVPAHVRSMSSDGMGTSGSESLPSIKPAHPFFGASYYDDSDLSDGSLVLNNPEGQGQQPPPQGQNPPKQKMQRRDRFPSFDSVGSSGSIRYVSPNRQLPPAPQHAQNQSDPSMLPYHERRKLMQARQQIQQQQQQAPPRPDRPGIPYMMPPPHPTEMGYFQPPPQQIPQQLPHQMPYPPYPMSMPPPMPHANYPMHPPPPPPGSPGMYSPYPFPNPMYPGYPPYPFQGPMSPAGHMHKAHNAQTPDRGQEAGARRAIPQKLNQKAASQHQSHARPPMPQPQRDSTVASSRDMPTLQRDSSMGSSFSYDSLDERDSRRNRKDIPPPPPPPPPLPPPTNNSKPLPSHVRQESTGSVSSLGSMDESTRTNTRRRGSRTASFFHNLNPWSPKDAAHKQPNVHDFHRKNQQFLSTVGRPNLQFSTSQAQRMALSSMDRPPPSSGGHRRLDSIDNDDWEEEDDGPNDEYRGQRRGRREKSRRRHREEIPTHVSSSDITDDEAELSEPDERTKLLPPSGISSNEYYDAARRDHGKHRSHRNFDSMSSRDQYSQSESPSVRETMRTDNTKARSALQDLQPWESERRKQKKKKDRHRSRRQGRDHSSGSSSYSSGASSKDYPRWQKKRAKYLERERAKWRAEVKKEEEEERRRKEEELWYRRLYRCVAGVLKKYFDFGFQFFAWAEAFIANLPLTIGAIALALATLGVDWFKFAEENMKSCEPVHFHSAQCTFPEFPGCFYCDTSARMYKVALNFHFACSSFAAILAFSFVAKLFFARRVVFDELSSPTTASPAGLICMTMDVVFAGRGFLGMVVVSIASGIHLCLAIWFIYMALAYHIMPDPSWFPNTVGIGISAVKLWLYHPMAGHFLMAISLSLNFFFFPISLIRVAFSKKISATVGWIQMSAPSVSLYALTIMAQPSFEEEHPDISSFQKVHRRIYLPLMHVLFALCLLGMLASVSSLIVRWEDFVKHKFSPAHAAFCVPTLSHANAVQAYLASINSFSTLPKDSWFRIFLYSYWLFVLFLGTVLTVGIGAKFLYKLPEWTHIDTEGEIEPPAPNETAMSLTHMITTGETLVQHFVSPAVLQANETGALVLTRDEQGHQKYVRTRKVTALGFEPIMNVIEMERERDILLEWVGKNPPRRRHRTLSVPGIDFSYPSMGSGHEGVFGMEEGQMSPWVSRSGRRRAHTHSSPYDQRQSFA